MASLTDKVVLITGASGTVGRGVALAFSKEGCKVALSGRNQERLDETAKQCQDLGAKTFVKTADITKPDEVNAMVDEVVKHFGSLDILVNGAGIIRPGVFKNVTMDSFDGVFSTNLRGTFTVCKAAMPHVVATKGAIINISSFTGIRPCSLYFAYSMAGATLDQFTKALALELGPKGVRVNSVNPGVVKGSDLFKRPGAPLAKATPQMYEKNQEIQKSMYPMGRLTEVEDIAKAVVFLASDRSSFINGAILPVDGGKVLTSKGMVEEPLVA